MDKDCDYVLVVATEHVAISATVCFIQMMRYHSLNPKGFWYILTLASTVADKVKDLYVGNSLVQTNSSERQQFFNVLKMKTRTNTELDALSRNTASEKVPSCCQPRLMSTARKCHWGPRMSEGNRFGPWPHRPMVMLKCKVLFVDLP